MEVMRSAAFIRLPDADAEHDDQGDKGRITGSEN